jgi:predicted ATPase
MIKSTTITNEFKNWYRLYCSKEKELTIEFKDGVNVLVSPNGKGKTTFLKAIHSLIINPNDTSGVSISAKSNPERPNVFFFSIKDMNPELEMHKISPLDHFASEKSALLIQRNMLSHGQSTSELMDDIVEIVNNGTAGCIIIDEPEIALDAINLSKLIYMLNTLKDKAQFIIVSHHPWLVLNNDFNVVNFVDELDYQSEMQQQANKLNLIGD